MIITITLRVVAVMASPAIKRLKLPRFTERIRFAIKYDIFNQLILVSFKSK